MRELVSFYVLLSIFMSALITILKIVIHKPYIRNSFPREKLLNQQVEEGHLEKGKFGDKVVYYEKDVIGEKAVIAIGMIEKLKKKNLVFYLLFIISLDFVSEFIVWPKTLSDMFTKKGKQ